MNKQSESFVDHHETQLREDSFMNNEAEKIEHDIYQAKMDAMDDDCGEDETQYCDMCKAPLADFITDGWCGCGNV